MLKERRSTRLDGGRLEVAAALACGYCEVVDLDDAGQVGLSCVAIGVQDLMVDHSERRLAARFGDCGQPQQASRWTRASVPMLLAGPALT